MPTPASRPTASSVCPAAEVEGHLDNFVGCHAVMQAYFSGKMDSDRIRIELTWGEEIGLLGGEGARRIALTL